MGNKNSNKSVLSKTAISTINQKPMNEPIRLKSPEIISILDSISDGLFIIDEKYKLQYTNPSLIRRFGSSEDRKCYEYFSDADGPCPWCKCIDVFAGQSCQWGWNCPKSGKFYNTSAFSFTDADGNIRSLMILRDITPRKQKVGSLQETKDDLQRTLKEKIVELDENKKKLEKVKIERTDAKQSQDESEKKFQVLVEHIPAISYLAPIDESSELLYVSPQVKEILGFSSQEYQANPDIWCQQLHPDDRERILSEVTSVHKTGQPFVSEYRMLSREGEVVWIHNEAVVVKDQNGKVLFIQGVMFDITKSKEKEHRLMAQATKLQDQAQLLDLAHDSIIVHDMDGRIIFWNRGAEQTFGYGKEEAEGKLCYKLLKTKFSEPLLTITAQLFREGRWDGELVHTSINNTAITMASRWALRRDGDGNPTAILEIDNDVSKHKQWETRLKALTEELISADEKQRQSVVAVLHDSIGQSLAFSKRELGALVKYADEKMLTSLNQVRDEISKAIKQSRELTADMSSPTLDTFGLKAGIEELAEEFSEKEQFNCCFQCGEQPMPVADHTKKLLYSSVHELLINAAKHAKAKDVLIDMRRTGQDIQITVEDDGRGFNVSALEKLSRRKKGLGLFSIRHHLTNIGGQFNIESSKGKGTKVVLLAPLEKKQRKTENNI